MDCRDRPEGTDLTAMHGNTLHQRHCEEPEATKQSSFLVVAKLDCFAALAMTAPNR